MQDTYDFTDDFLFCTVLRRNKDLCIGLIERILDIKVKDIKYLGSQETIKMVLDGKGIRLDVYVEDDQNTVFDLEMQTTVNKGLAKRSRYYQSMIDQTLIEKGVEYSKLKNSFVIFICTKDPFGRQLGRYRFAKNCLEDKSIMLNDGANVVFLNADGNEQGLNKDLAVLLRYIKTGKPEDQFTQKVAEQVDETCHDAQWRKDRMTLEMVYREKFAEGKAEGIAEGKAEGKAEGIAEGKAEGIAEGEAKTYASLIQRGLLTIRKAVELSGIPEETLQTYVDKLEK